MEAKASGERGLKDPFHPRSGFAVPFHALTRRPGADRVTLPAYAVCVTVCALTRHGSNTKLRDENFELDTESLALLCRSHFAALQQSRASQAQGARDEARRDKPCPDVSELILTRPE